MTSQLTKLQNEILSELFENVRDALDMLTSMADGMLEASADVDHSLREAIECLKPED